MASKKGSKKKTSKKGTVVSLQSFLAEENSRNVGMMQVTKKVISYDEMGEESALPLIVELPTAPRAVRLYEDELLPNAPPYICYVHNLPFDVEEEDIYNFFGCTSISSLYLPRSFGESSRIRGFAKVDFVTREDLVQALSHPDPYINGRKIRIELSNISNDETMSGSQRSRRGGHYNIQAEEERVEITDWRSTCSTANREAQQRSSYSRSQLSSDNNHDPSHEGNWRRSPDSNSDTGSWRLNNRAEPSYKRAEEIPERPSLNLKKRTLPLPEFVEATNATAEHSYQADDDATSIDALSEQLQGAGLNEARNENVSNWRMRNDASEAPTPCNWRQQNMREERSSSWYERRDGSRKRR